jgi:hypothetical protein
MEPLLDEKITNSLDDLQESALLLGVSPREFTALMGHRSIGQHHVSRTGHMGHTDMTPLILDNEYYKNLLMNDWMRFTVPASGKEQYMAMKGTDTSYALRSDFLLTLEPSFLAAVQDFSADNDVFLEEFASAWTKVMNADRFDGPVGNLCKPYTSMAEEVETPGCSKDDSMSNLVFIGAIAALSILTIVSLFLNFTTMCSKPKKKEDDADFTKPKLVDFPSSTKKDSKLELPSSVNYQIPV